MEPFAKQYKASLGKKEAFLVWLVTAQGKVIEDASRLVGEGARKMAHRLARKKWVLPLKRGLYAMVPLDGWDRSPTSRICTPRGSCSKAD